MRIIDLKHPNIDAEIGDCGLCLGNFDGVHRGHRALIDELVRQNKAREVRLPLGALLFTRPPAAVLFGHAAPQLNTAEEKLELLREAGLRFAVLFDFEELKDMEPDEFVRQILIETCHCRLAVCGFNYTYGAKGAGDVARLASTFGAHPDRTLAVVPPVTEGGQTVSSSLIRTLLEQGRPEEAARLLGRPFFLTGTVQSGKHVGNTLGYPTANLTFPKGGLVPAHGVYLSTVRVGRRTYYGLSNVGTRPTFDDGNCVNCETFLLDFHGDLYGKQVRISLLRYLRAEQQFPTVEALQAQIAQDIRRAKDYIWS